MPGFEIGTGEAGGRDSLSLAIESCSDAVGPKKQQTARADLGAGARRSDD